MQVLLRNGMKALMTLAGNTQQQPYPVTHALNILAAIFLDKVLSNDIQSFVVQGIPRSSLETTSQIGRFVF